MTHTQGGEKMSNADKDMTTDELNVLYRIRKIIDPQNPALKMHDELVATVALMAGVCRAFVETDEWTIMEDISHESGREVRIYHLNGVQMDALRDILDQAKLAIGQKT